VELSGDSVTIPGRMSDAGGTDHPRASVYRDRAARSSAIADALATLSRRISRLRLVTFLLGAAALTLALLDPEEAAVVHWILAAAGFGTFAALVRWHESVTARERDAAAVHRVNERATLRLERQFARLPVVEFPPESMSRPVARDLNLFGPASVAQWIGAVSTPAGRETLARWFGAGAPPAEIVDRQRAVDELAPEIDFRQRFEVEGERLARTSLAAREFVAWAAETPWIERRPGMRRAARFAVVASAATLLLAALGLAPTSLWLLVLVGNYAWTWLFKRELDAAMAAMAAREGAFAGYAALLRLSTGREPRTARLRAIAARVAASGLDAATELDRLHRLAELSDARRSSLHALLQAACAWDLLLLDRIGTWQRRAGRHVGDWLSAVGELEVLSAFAGLRFDEPSWAYAEIDPAADRLLARGLAHPLLAADVRVANDVEIGPLAAPGSPGRFLLVTGSNMSGKSTLLRAVGVNAILAEAGAPVCAAAYRSPPLRVETSGRIDDSLAEGVSFFLAELARLKRIVERAADPEGPRVLFLLDELLRGTNSEERRQAVATIVSRLLDEGAIGALSTHDLELAALPALAGRFRAVHFRDELEEGATGPKLTFDYLLREGLATTTNALVLLRLVGLGPPTGAGRAGQPQASGSS
jgi:hypothetical protein